jgi:hypothetical protein
MEKDKLKQPEVSDDFEIQEVDEDLEYKDRISQTLMVELSVSERKDILAMRKLWASVFLVVIFAILFFEIGLTVAVGLGYLKFVDEWFLRIIILGGIAQILAMPYLVTQFLFKKQTETP